MQTILKYFRRRRDLAEQTVREQAASDNPSVEAITEAVRRRRLALDALELLNDE